MTAIIAYASNAAKLVRAGGGGWKGLAQPYSTQRLAMRAGLVGVHMPLRVVPGMHDHERARARCLRYFRQLLQQKVLWQCLRCSLNYGEKFNGGYSDN